jgi:hypothetical protein
MPGKNDKITFEGCEPSTLFREFAAECMELAQTTSSPEKHALFAKNRTGIQNTAMAARRGGVVIRE